MEPVPTARDAHAAAISGEWPTVYEFYSREQISPVNESGDTILHILSRCCHSNIIRRLLQPPLLVDDCLLAQNHTGNTALHEAIRVGSIEIVEIMVGTDEQVLSTRNDLGETPLYCAAAFGRKQILHFLYDRNNTYHLLWRHSDSRTILHAAVNAKFYDLALDIFALFPQLALARCYNDGTALHLLARSPASFRSGTGYTFKNIGSSPFILLQIVQVFIYIIIPCQCCITIADWRDMDMMDIRCAIMSGLRWIIRLWPLGRTVSDAKDMHSNAKRLAKKLINFHANFWALLSDEERTCFGESFHLAIQFGVVELVEIVLKQIPHAWGMIKYVKDMSKVFMLISILIVVINFQAWNIVPGGYNQNTGHPDLDGFLLHASVALFCSFTSLAAALSAHLSAFDIEDYYLSLPLKLYVGGTMLFMAVNCTLSACVHAIRLKTQDSSYPHTGQGLYFVRHYGIVGIRILTLLSYIEIMYPIFIGVLCVCLPVVGNMQYNLIRSIRINWPNLIGSLRISSSNLRRLRIYWDNLIISILIHWHNLNRSIRMYMHNLIRSIRMYLGECLLGVLCECLPDAAVEWYDWDGMLSLAYIRSLVIRKPDNSPVS